MTDIKRRIDALPPEKRALLEQRLREKQRGTANEPIPVQPRDGQPMPLSFAQERLWVMYNMDPANVMYNIPGVARIKAFLDADTVERAINEIVRRHAILRATFHTGEGQAVQRIAPSQHLRLLVNDLRDLPPAEQAAAAEAITRDVAEAPFDLHTGPLLRAALLHCSDGDVLVINMHHIISDDWSAGIFVGELMALVGAFAAGQPSPLPELPVQYIDYALWQRNRVQSELLQKQLGYWQQQLAAAPSLLALPTDHPRPLIQTFRGARETLTFPPALLERVKELGRREGVTLFMTMLAVFKTMLHRYTGQSDLLVGTPITNRTRAELEPLIGCFVNMLVLRTEVDGDLSFREALGRVRKTALDAYANSDVPFEKLVQVLRPERNTSYTPLFQVAFVLQDPTEMHTKMLPVVEESRQYDTGNAKFDLALEIDEVNGALETALVYATDLFDRETITRMLGHLQTLTESAVANPDQPLASLPMLTFGERYEILEKWNATELPGDGRLVPEAFEAQAARTPDALALVAGGRRLTYRELNERANRLAHYLRERGVAPDQRVGVCLERTEHLIVTLLAVWKAGGGYVPIDPAYPEERIKFLLSDSEMSLLVKTRAWTCDGIPETVGQIDLDALALESYPAENPTALAEPHHLAYMIYTSGTTGKPKAVMIEHGNLRNVLLASQHAFGFGSDDVIPCIASFSFDIFLFELMNPLLAGATSLLLSQEETLDLPRLVDELSAMTMIHTVPSLMRQIVQTIQERGAADRYDRLKRIFIGGDAVPPALLTDMQRIFPSTQINILYGPTEATIICATHPLQRGETIDRHLIGKPLGNMMLRLYDPQRALVPAGVPGEIYIGGAGVARGYLNRPELNADKFVEFEGQRWYRTGDLARYLPDGTIEFLGRIDQQVKIRGFRVELGEIEAVLTQHPAIREAIVIAREEPGTGGQQDKRLVAYLVPDAGQTVTTSELFGFLQQQLPSYMVPSAFIMLEMLPLTAHGKVDRKALPEPDRVRPDLAANFVAPSSELEQALAAIWGEILGRENIGVHDNFFELGGDSILSLQIVSRANGQGINITSKHMFQYQTIAELAGVAASAPRIEAEQGLVSGPAPLTPIQAAFLERDQPHPEHFNQAMLFRVAANISPAILGEVAEHLGGYHDALRLRFERDGDSWRQSHADSAGAIAFEVVDLAGLADADRQALVARELERAQSGFDLAGGPLMRWVLFAADQDQSRLLITAHHLVFDGVSWRILLEDLQTAYFQRASGQPIQLPPKTTSFKAWADHLREYAATADLAAQLPFWQEQRDWGDPALPLDFPDGDNAVASAATVTEELSEAETQRLLNDLPAEYHAGVDDLLLSALALTITEWSGQPRLVVELESHGRADDMFERISLARTIGWFTSSYPLALDVAAATGPQAAVMAVKEATRQVVNHGLGYGMLRYLRDDGAALKELPAPAISFNYLGQFGQERPGAGPALLTLIDGEVGPLQSPEQQRAHAIDVNALVAGGRLRVQWTYSQSLHHRMTIEQLAQSFLRNLQLLADPSQSSAAYIPSDFPMANLDQDKLRLIMQRLNSTEA